MNMKAQFELIYERADVIRRDASWNLAMIALDEGISCSGRVLS